MNDNPAPTSSAPVFSSSSAPPITPPSPAPIVSSSGYAPESNPKSSRKIILAIIVVLVLAGALIALYLLFIRPLQNPTIADTAKSFNTYANYLLYGEKSDAEIMGKYDHTKLYKMESMLGSTDNDISQYFDEANNLLGDFVKKYQSVAQNLYPDEPTEELFATVTEYQKNFEFYRLYAISGELTREELLSDFVSKNATTIASVINDKYARLVDSDNTDAKTYGDLKIEQANNQVLIFTEYSEKGCIVNNQIDYDCLTNQVFGEQLPKYQDRIGEIGDIADAMIASSTKLLLSNCWNFSAGLALMVDAE